MTTMQKPTRILFKYSKRLHKYVGLIGLAYFLIMAISGVLLNHPSLIRKISVPQGLLPSGFRYSNWDRMVMREVVFSEGEPSMMIVGGKAGVWQSLDGGRSFVELTVGFPPSAYDRDTFCLLLTGTPQASSLYAGTRSGLYRYDFERAGWQAIDRRHFGNVEIVDLVQRGNQILVWTSNGCYALEGPETVTVLHPVPLTSGGGEKLRVPLTRLLLRLHDGSIFGLSGKLFVDILGLLLIFLSCSAIVIWFIPWKRKRSKKRNNGSRIFRILHGYHLKFGICTAFFMVAVALTGMFIRPPLRQIVFKFTVPTGWLSNARPPVNEWDSIARAIYQPRDDSLLVATRDGFFKGPADFSRPFERLTVKVPVGGMGVNVLENLADGRILIGSFKGLYVWDPATGGVTDMGANPSAGGGRAKIVNRAVGAAVHQGELVLWADYRAGVKMIRPGEQHPVMPPGIATNAGMSLWHFLFLVHNGRIFQHWTGKYTWLIVPIGGLALLISAFCGSYDWLHRKGVWRVKKRS
jgi:hypothetical protein